MTHDLESLERLISPEGLASLLGVQVETLQLWRRRGLGPKWYRMGRQIRYSEAAALEWLRSQSQQDVDTRRASEAHSNEPREAK